MTDEDAMIKIFENHRDTITYIINKLEEGGVKSFRTKGNVPGSDILLIDPSQMTLAREIIANLHEE